MANIVKIAVADAEDILFGLKGLASLKVGSSKFKGKCVVLEREIRAQLRKVTKEADELRGELTRKIQLGQATAQLKKEPFLLTSDISEMQGNLVKLQNEANEAVIEVKSPLILESELPTDEELKDEQSFRYSYIDQSGNTQYKEFAPTTLIAFVLGTLTTDGN